jgi:hypothetical protein
MHIIKKDSLAHTWLPAAIVQNVKVDEHNDQQMMAGQTYIRIYVCAYSRDHNGGKRN